MPVRIPESMVGQFKAWVDNSASSLRYYDCRVAAGVPLPVEENAPDRIEINDLLKIRDDSTFIVTVRGDSMDGAGIHDGDHLVVDPKDEPSDGDIVIAAVDGEVTVKRLKKGRAGKGLYPENPSYRPIKLDASKDVVIQGVVRAVVRSF